MREVERKRKEWHDKGSKKNGKWRKGWSNFHYRRHDRRADQLTGIVAQIAEPKVWRRVLSQLTPASYSPWVGEQTALVHSTGGGRDGPRTPGGYAMTGRQWTDSGHPAANIRLKAATPRLGLLTPGSN